MHIAMLFGPIPALGLSFVAVSWIDETLAELFAISKIGIDSYRSIREKTKPGSDASLIRIQYPPDSLILLIARRREIS
jgi:hypothetical protein